MATQFPSALDALVNPQATDTQSAVSHSAQHQNANDAIEALEAKVGIDDSAVESSHDFKIRALEEAFAGFDPDVDIEDVDGLQEALDSKALAVHTHVISDVTGLQAALDGKSSTGHSHAISDVSGLQTALDGKAASSHTHDDRYYTEGETNTLLSAKAAASHTHAISDTTGLQSALDGKVTSTRSVSAGTGLSGGGDLSQDRTISLANTAVTPGSYTSANITVDAQGRITAAESGTAGVSSVSNSDSTLTISPTTGAVVASLNLAKANTWTGVQTHQKDIIIASTLGSEMLTNGTFTGGTTGWTLASGWAYNSNNVQHSSNGSGTLTPNPAITPIVGENYLVQFTLSTMTGVGGSVTVACGGVTFAAITASSTTKTYTLYFTAISTANLTFTPSTTSRFTIDDISLKQYSGQHRLINTSTPIAESQPLSAPIVFESLGYKSNAPAASQTVKWREYLLPVTGASAPTARLTWQYSINGGAWTTALFMASDSGMNFPGLTASRPLKLNSSKTVVASQIDLGSASDITGVLQVPNGGTGQSTFGDGAIPYYDLTNAPAVLSYDVEDFYRYHIRERYGIGIGQTDNSLLNAKVTVRPGYECTGTPAACATFVEMAGCEEQGCTWNESGTCSSYIDEETCNADPLCAWDAGTSCGGFVDQETCEAQSPCVWNDYDCHDYDGTDPSTCTSGHPGCTWDTAPCSEFDSNQIGCEGQAGCTWDTANCDVFNGTDEGTCEGNAGCTWSDDIACSTYNETDQATCETGHAGCTWESANCTDFNGNEASCTAETGCTWDTANCDGFNDNYGGCTGAPEAACTWSGGAYDCSLSDGTDQGTCEGNAGCTWNAGLNECQGTCSGTYEPGTCSGTYFTGNCTGTWNPETCTGTYALGTCSGEYALNTCSGTWGTPDCTGLYGTGCDEAPFCDGTPSDCDTALTEGNCGLLDGCAWTEELTEHWLGDGLIDGDLEVVGQTTSGSYKWVNGTSGRVLYMTTSGVFTDSGNMTFDGTKLTVSQLNVTDQSWLDSHVYIGDNRYIVGGTSTGLGILSSPSEKMAFWNKSPRITQPANTSALNDVITDVGLRASGGLSNFSTTIKPRTGGTAAGSEPIKFTSGSLLTAATAGTLEFLTDKFYATITTSAARKELTLNDAALTSGRVPFVTTNGRLTDDSDFTFATDTLTVTKLVAPTSIAVGGGSAITALAAGTYTPTRSAEANMDSNVTMTEAQYLRVGNTVTVSGRFTADPTLTATTTSFEITLPVASNIGAAEDVAGVAFCGSIVSQGAEVIGVAANDTAKVLWKSSDVTSQVWSYTFTYQVI